MNWNFAVAAILICSLAGVARAQPGRTPPDAISPADPPPARAVPAEHKSPAAAFGWALGGTALGIGALVASGASDSEDLFLPALAFATVAPSFGHFYAGDWGGGLAHTGVRAGGIGIATTGLVLVFRDLVEEAEAEAGGTGGLLIIGGTAVWVGGTIYSIATAPGAARDANQRSARVMVAPAPIRGPGHSTGAGMAVLGQF